MRKKVNERFEEVASVENLLAAWQEFLVGKKSKPDVQEFQRHLLDHLVQLHNDLVAGRYQHGGYYSFSINDPKPRKIHKASVRDRVLHHAIYRLLYPVFDRQWIADSFSCRNEKGTHKAMDRFRTMARQVSRNHSKTCWVLSCDIRKFFASIDQTVLFSLLKDQLTDARLFALIENVVRSFNSGLPGRGLPLGNLTSQLLVNIYMNPFDQFVKHHLKFKHYIRYADDFVFLSDNRNQLLALLPRVETFLEEYLHLALHPNKTLLKTIASGVDFLGWVHFPDHRVLRTKTKCRTLRRLKEHPTYQTAQSYLGLLSHGNAVRLSQAVANDLWMLEG